ncbi:MAG TPA: efflux RND transporter periplasmic adaptor subunit [Candidatus Didemnitutus sp.]|nr:efflux RND transporter periplasmic adaptor subunit [Candidatus Didemnitutus sp.]
MSACNRADSVAATVPAIPVQTAVAQVQDIPRQVESIGTVQAVRTVTVKSQVDGVIAEIKFNEGDEVKAGDLLVALDRRPFENSLRSARADLANANAMADQAQADLDRYQRLDQQSAISKEEYVQYVTKNETAKAQVQSRAAAVANAELQLSYAEIRAPIAGRTGQRLLHEGAVVKANDNSFAIVTINQLAPIAVAYSVPEGSLPDIRAAMHAGEATITATDPLAGVSRTDGHLQFVDNAIDPTTGTIVLKAVFPNADHALWPGQFVRVLTVTGIDHNAVVVPSSAVQTGQDTAQVFVVKADHTVDLRPVQVARVVNDQSLLSSGVRGGETVVSDGQLRLVPGARVESARGGGGTNSSPAAN